MAARPPYLPPGKLPGESQKRTQRKGAAPADSPRWLTVVGTMIVTSLVALGISLSINGQNSVQAQLTALAAATSTAAYTPPPTFTPTPVDSDADTIPDARDNCILVSNPQQEDADDDGVGDQCDPDADGDGIPGEQDNCPFIPDNNRLDTDDDSEGDLCDSDDDGDEVEDVIDNCPLLANPDQSDMDGDGAGDACDTAFDLAGLEISVQGSTPIFVGSTSGAVLLRVGYGVGKEPTPGASLQWVATAGSFRPPEQTCADSGSALFIMPEAGEVRYCPPDELAPVIVTVREVNTTGHAVGGGAQITLDTRQDSLTPSVALAAILNTANEIPETPLSRCYMDKNVMGIDLEVEAIPLIFTLRTANSEDTGRNYAVDLTLPPGSLYIVRNNDCMPVTVSALSGSGEFVAAINLPYTLFYVPGSDLRDMRLTVEVLDSTIDFDIPPLLKATRPVRFRIDSGEAAGRLNNGERALLTGVTDDGTWARVKVVGDDRDMWLNLAQEPVSGAIMGATFDIPTVEPPTYAGTGG